MKNYPYLALGFIQIRTPPEKKERKNNSLIWPMYRRKNGFCIQKSQHQSNLGPYKSGEKRRYKIVQITYRHMDLDLILCSSIDCNTVLQVRC